MPYLARIPLNPLRRGGRDLLVNPQRMHAAVEGSLPPQRSGRLLWRLENDGTNVSLLVQSPDWPNFQHLVEQAGWPGNDAGEPQIRDLAPLLAMIAKGRQFNFRVRLNTVSATRRVDHPNTSQQSQLTRNESVRVGQRTVGHQLDWFLRRSAGEQTSWGLNVAADETRSAVQIVGREHLRFWRNKTTGPVTLDVATFEGMLTVTDAAQMRNSILQGIGRAKAYGCGLLTLAAPNV